MRIPFMTLAIAATLGLSACGDGADARQDANPEPGAPQPRAVDVEQVPIDGIDWATAQADMARDADKADASGMAQVASAGDPAPVPVLMPTVIRPQSAGEPLYIATEDGYFANIPGPRYDIVMNGTIARFDNPGETGTTKDEEGYDFRATKAGAQVALSLYGADYVIEFECNIIGEDQTCIGEAEAVEVAEGLVVSRGQ